MGRPVHRRTGEAGTVLEELMSKLLKALAAGYGAKKLGGGCISTVLIFIVLYWLLGRLF